MKTSTAHAALDSTVDAGTKPFSKIRSVPRDARFLLAGIEARYRRYPDRLQTKAAIIKRNSRFGEDVAYRLDQLAKAELLRVVNFGGKNDRREHGKEVAA